MQMAFGLCLVAHIEDENLLGEILECSGAGSRQRLLLVAAVILWQLNDRLHPVSS